MLSLAHSNKQNRMLRPGATDEGPGDSAGPRQMLSLAEGTEPKTAQDQRRMLSLAHSNKQNRMLRPGVTDDGGETAQDQRRMLSLAHSNKQNRTWRPGATDEGGETAQDQDRLTHEGAPSPPTQVLLGTRATSLYDMVRSQGA